MRREPADGHRARRLPVPDDRGRGSRRDGGRGRRGPDAVEVGDGVVDAPQDATMIATAATQANLARIVVLPGRLR